MTFKKVNLTNNSIDPRSGKLYPTETALSSDPIDINLTEYDYEFRANYNLDTFSQFTFHLYNDDRLIKSAQYYGNNPFPINLLKMCQDNNISELNYSKANKLRLCFYANRSVTNSDLNFEYRIIGEEIPPTLPQGTDNKIEFEIFDKINTMKYIQGQDITISCEVETDSISEFEKAGILFQYQLEGQDTYTDVKAEVTGVEEITRGIKKNGNILPSNKIVNTNDYILIKHKEKSGGKYGITLLYISSRSVSFDGSGIRVEGSSSYNFQHNERTIYSNSCGTWQTTIYDSVFFVISNIEKINISEGLRKKFETYIGPKPTYGEKEKYYNEWAPACKVDVPELKPPRPNPDNEKRIGKYRIWVRTKLP